MTNKQKYHALIIDSVGDEADWGFYDLGVNNGVIGLRVADHTPAGAYDTFIAPGEWKYIDTIMPEDDE